MHPEVHPDSMGIEVASIFLQDLGTDSVAHSGRTLSEHLHGTHALLSVWRQPEALCIAGLLHSLYTTASGKQFLANPPSREALVLRFGAEIEALVFGYSRYQQAASMGPVPMDALQAQLAIVYLANLVDQTIYMPRQVAPRMAYHLQRVRRGLPPEVAAWMDDFMPLLRWAF